MGHGPDTTILLAEDEAIIALEEAMLLKRNGFRVLTAHNGEEAVALLKANPQIDLVLMDIDLGPGIDGTEAAARILAERDLPVVFLSSHTEPEVVAKTERITSYGYIVKNSGETVMIASLKMALKLYAANKKTREHEAALRLHSLVLDQISDLITITDLDGVITYVNKVVKATINKGTADLIGQPTRVFGENPDKGAAQQEIVETTLRDGFWQGLVVNFSDDGREHIMKSRTQLVYDEHGTPIAMCGISSDITEQKNMEQKLQESETLYRELVDLAVDGILVGDAKGVIIKANQAFCQMSGLSLADVIGKHITALPFEEESIQREPLRFDLLDAGETVKRQRVLRRPDGQRIHVEMHSKKMPSGYQSIFRDMNEWRQNEIRLSENEERIRTLSDNLPDGLVYQIDSGESGQERRFTHISAGVERLHGVPVAEAMRDAMTVYRQVHPEDLPALISREHAAAMTMSLFRAEARVCLPSGLVRWRLFVSAPRRQSDNHLIWDGLEIDITRSKRIEQRLLEREHQIRSISDNLPDGLVYRMDIGPDGTDRRFTFISAGVERLHGITPAAALRDSSLVYRQIHEEDAPRLARTEAEAIAGLHPFHAEVRIRKPSGEIRWVQISSIPHPVPDGRTVWDGVELDITARKQTGAAP